VYESWEICSDQVLHFSGASFLSYATRTVVEAAHATYLHHDKKKTQARSCKNLDLEGCTDISSVCTYFSLVLQIDVIGLCSDCNSTWTAARLVILILGL
jgi:hypothetical protein